MLLISWHQLSIASVLRNPWEASPFLNRKRGVVDGGQAIKREGGERDWEKGGDGKLWS